MFPSPFDRSASPALPPHPPNSNATYHSHPPPQNTAVHPRRDRKTHRQMHPARDTHESPTQIQTSARRDNTAASAAISASQNCAARSTDFETDGSAPPDRQRYSRDQSTQSHHPSNSPPTSAAGSPPPPSDIPAHRA